MGKRVLSAVVTIGFIASLAGAGPARAHEAEEGKKNAVVAAVKTQEEQAGDRQIIAQVSTGDKIYQDIKELQDKYGSAKKLPEGRFCSKDELVDCFIATLIKVVEKYGKEGAQAIQRDDMESIRATIVALEDELFRKDAYREIRRSIEQILVLVEPAAPVFKYKLGVNGFLRGEGAGNFSLSDSSYNPEHGVGRFAYRVKPYSYWHPTDYLDIHLEGQSYGLIGGNSQNFNKTSLYQGFVEGKIPDGNSPGKNFVSLKAGRQEFVYGSAFMLGSDTFFDGLSFDAVRLRVQPQSNLTLDLLGGRYATPFSGGTKGSLAGGYLTYKPAEDSSLEVYGLRDTGSEERHAGEHLDILGLRSTSTVGVFALEYEAVFESGKLFNPASGENDTISASGGHVDLTREFKLFGLDNTLVMGIAVGSGDKDAANGIRANREFRNPNNDTSLVGDMHVVGDLSGLDVNGHHASGMQVYTLGWGVELSKKLNLSATGHKFVAGSVEDGFSRDIGVEADLNLTYTVNRDYSVIFAYDHFFTDAFFRDASGSGKDIDYAYIMLVFNYDWTRRKRSS